MTRQSIDRRLARFLTAVSALGVLPWLAAFAVFDPSPFTESDNLINRATGVALLAAGVACSAAAWLRRSAPDRAGRRTTMAFWGATGLAVGVVGALQLLRSHHAFDHAFCSIEAKGPWGIVAVAAVGTITAYWFRRYRAGLLAIGRTALVSMIVGLGLLGAAVVLDRIGGVAEYAEEAAEFAGAVFLLAAPLADCAAIFGNRLASASQRAHAGD